MYDGSRWHTIKNLGCVDYATVTISLPEEYYSSNSKIRILGVCNDPWGCYNPGFFIDDVKVTTEKQFSDEVINHVSISYVCIDFCVSEVFMQNSVRARR